MRANDHWRQDFLYTCHRLMPSSRNYHCFRRQKLTEEKSTLYSFISLLLSSLSDTLEPHSLSGPHSIDIPFCSLPSVSTLRDTCRLSIESTALAAGTRLEWGETSEALFLWVITFGSINASLLHSQPGLEVYTQPFSPALPNNPPLPGTISFPSPPSFHTSAVLRNLPTSLVPHSLQASVSRSFL